MNVNDIKMCIDNENISFVRDAAAEQLDALLANQIKGRCKDCECRSVHAFCFHANNGVGVDHYCSYFTPRSNA